MKNKLLGGVAAVVLAASAPTLAAAAPPPVFSWSGCYVGGSAGYGWAKEKWDGTSSGGFLTTVKDLKPKGWLYGGQIGCDYQLPATPWVVGLDGSFSWANLHGSALDGYSDQNGTWFNISHQKNLGLFTGRVGWAYGQFLLYARGGYATANFDFRNDYPGNYTGSENMRGWVAGVGYEWMLWQNVSVFVEYDWLKLKKNHAEFNYGYSADIDWTGDVVKAGINWHLWTP